MEDFASALNLLQMTAAPAPFLAAPRKPTPATRSTLVSSSSSESEGDSVSDNSVEDWQRKFESVSSECQWRKKDVWKWIVKSPLMSTGDLWKVVVGTVVPSDQEAKTFQLVVTGMKLAHKNTYRLAIKRFHSLKN